MLQELNPARERRSTEKLRRYWSSVAGENAVPCLSGFSIRINETEWRKRFLLKEDVEPSMSVFIFCGANAQMLFDGSPVSKTMLEAAPPHLRDDFCRNCENVTSRLDTVSEEGSYWLHGEEVFYRYILLPVTSSSHERGYILGAFSTSS